MASPMQTESMSRVTREGRTITYTLTVIQQPERARACGSGAKSSADRRPVDPPPVVELKIYEGEGPNKTDITFSYTANFFLYTHLEPARPMINGRVAAANATMGVPVLTGCPVSGMAYLDRPAEAGYFIFPDLSVRHEGMFKLCFNLYEETKDPKDMSPSKEHAEEFPHGSFDWRLEIKSAVFQVFSAKKFPGLAESTQLSRVVAEQGCRVRIRRDVRMRRREGKGSEVYDEEDFRLKAGTPDSARDDSARPRSVSHSPIDYSRRSSGEYPPPPAYNGAYGPPAPGGHSHNPGPYLNFKSQQATPYSAAPIAAPPPPNHGQPYAPAPSFQPPQPFRQQPPPPADYAYPSDRSHYQSYPSPRDNYPEDRRASLSGYAAAPPPQHYPSENPFARAQSLSYAPPRPHSPTLALAPLKIHSADVKREGVQSPRALHPAGGRMPPPTHSPGYTKRPSPYSNFSLPQAPLLVPEPPRTADTSRVGSKRPFGNVFNSTSVHSQALHNGSRPSDIHDPSASYDEDDEDPSLVLLEYKRADGSAYARELPKVKLS